MNRGSTLDEQSADERASLSTGDKGEVDSAVSRWRLEHGEAVQRRAGSGSAISLPSASTTPSTAPALTASNLCGLAVLSNTSKTRHGRCLRNEGARGI